VIVGALLALIAAAGSTLGMPVALRYVIDAGGANESATVIDRYFFALFILATITACFASLRFYLVSWLGERVVADIRSRVFQHVLKMSPTFFEVTRSGEILSRLTTDTTLIQSVVGSSLSIALRSGVTLIGALVMLIVTSPRLAGIIVLLVPTVVIPIIFFGKRVRRLSRDTQDRVADTSALASEVLNAMPLVQAFTLEAIHGNRYDESVERSFVTAKSRMRQRAILTAYAITTIFGGLVFVLWMGGHDVAGGRMSSGELGQFVLYAIFVGGSTAGLSEVWGALQQAAGATERLTELLQESPNERRSAISSRLPTPPRGEISFKNVGFNYPSRPSQLALRNFSLAIEHGETVALVGPSGAGKTTVFQRLLGFYQPQSGHIQIDGIDIATVGLSEIRRSIGIVPQDTVLFADSVLENIRYGRPDATDDEVYEAAQAAAAHDFIDRLPERFETFVGEHGVRLSGGQQQRIAIARAVLKAPPILLLDEATSALDTENETQIQDALSNLIQERTTLIIAHRLATVRRVDRIVVMESGVIHAVGTHTELLQKEGLYARLAKMQFKDSADDHNSAPLIR
jgi:ATP-binding cassette subfamily B protein